MLGSLKNLGIIALLIGIAGWIFYFHSFAIESSLRYRPLANGWVSYHPGLFMDSEGQLVEKIKNALADDLEHGRFRPAFTLYATLPYALSPLLHQRSVAEEGRPYGQLITGDLRLFSFILIGSMALAFVLMSLLIYRYTGELIFALIPAFFIPLSPSVTENLVQNYIDSQEIPLLLWMSGWLLFFFLAETAQNSTVRRGFLLLALVFLLMTFLAKETTVVISVALILVTALLWLLGAKKGLFITNSVVAILCTAAIYGIVSMSSTGYASNYSVFHAPEIYEALKRLWLGFSKYSLNSLYGYIPIGIFLLIAVKYRKQNIHGIPMSKHIALMLLLLLLCCGFFLILAPWRPILVKYLLPSIFFFSFAVALSLSILTAWLKERYGKKANVIYIILIPYIFYYNTNHSNAALERDYWADTANYGVAILERLAESIEQEVIKQTAQHQAVFMGLTKDFPWANLQLMRMLNLDKGINIVDASGSPLLNFTMPKAELTSFRYAEGKKNLYLSSKTRELTSRRFDVVYQGSAMGKQPEQVFSAGDFCYQATGERMDWHSRSTLFPAFSLHAYLPADCTKLE